MRSIDPHMSRSARVILSRVFTNSPVSGLAIRFGNIWLNPLLISEIDISVGT